MKSILTYCTLRVGQLLQKNNPQIEISGTEKYLNLNEEMINYMQTNFYNTAPIPNALGLSRESCKDTSAFVRKEIGDDIDSGASLVFTKKNINNTLSIVGCFLNNIWTRNTEYEIVGANAKIWHDAAAEIAMNHPNKTVQHLIWRKLQFLHIYDLGQVMLNQMPDKKFALYLGRGYANEEVRQSNIMDEGFSIILNNWDTKDCIIYALTTYSKMEPYIIKRLNSPSMVDEVKYEEEMLELDGVRCFKPCEQLGGMKFFVVVN